MADRRISDLTPASQVTNADLFVLEQNNTAKSLTGQILMQDLATALDGHGGISDITYTPPSTGSVEGTLTITLADGTSYDVTVTNGNGVASITQYWAVSDSNSSAPSVWYTTLQTMTSTYRYLWSYTTITFDDGNDVDTAPQVIGVYGDRGQAWYVHLKYASSEPTSDADMGDVPDEWVGVYSGTSATAPTHYTSYTWYGWKGDRGYTGNGIASVTKTGTSGLVDTYTVTFTDGNTTTFTVTNGSNISTITKTGTSGLTDIYTVTLTNGQTTTFTVTNGKAITSITWTSTTSPSGTPHTAGATDTYTISYNDGDTSTFQVYNGSNGSGTVTSVDSIPADGNNVPLLTIGTGAPTTATQGNVKSRYFDTITSILYICVGYDSGTGEYDWRGTGVTVDSALSTSSTNPVQNKIITGKVGTSALNTTAQNLSGAVNELLTDIGDVSQMTTTATDLASAVNELDGDISTINTAISVISTDLANKLNLDGTSISLWGSSQHNLNNLITGTVLCNEYVINVPTADWWLVISAGDDSGTRTQVAYSLWNTSMPRTRHCASGTWSAWESIPAVAKSGDTMTGSLNLNSSNVTSGSASTAYGNTHLNVNDANGVNFGYFQPVTISSGQGIQLQGIQFAATRGGTFYHGVTLYIDANGNRSAYFDAPDAWRSGLSVPLIQKGEITSGSLSANADTDISVSFNTSYSSAPTVVASISQNTGYSERVLWINRTTASTTGVTFRVHNPYSSSQDLSASKKITWIAVG